MDVDDAGSDARPLPPYARSYAAVLEALYDGEKCQELSARLGLFSFVIHDARNHRDFDLEVKDLLFGGQYDLEQHGAFVPSAFLNAWRYRENEPEEEITGQAGCRSSDSDNPRLVSLLQAMASVDPSIAAASLASSLRIPQQYLPCLVVTTDFYWNQFEWFSTDRFSLLEQFEQLRTISGGIQGFGRFGKTAAVAELLPVLRPAWPARVRQFAWPADHYIGADGCHACDRGGT